MKPKRIFIAFLGNAYLDTRLTNLYTSLVQMGHEVYVTSFDWASGIQAQNSDKIAVNKLDKSGSSLKYYFNFIRILFNALRKSKADIYIAEDVYTLPLVSVFAKLNKAKLYYDCRELYPFLAGLRNKKITQSVIKFAERMFIGKADFIITTGSMDAEFIQNYYKTTNTVVLRNLPKLREIRNEINLRYILNIPADCKILLYQGVLFEGRGLEKTLTAIKDLHNIHFVLLGEGNIRSTLERLAHDLKIGERVHFLGQIQQELLHEYTSQADYGLALIENISLSYYYALPNKMFEYIAAGIPVISSSLPQMKDIIETYNVGWIVDIEAAELKDELNKVFSDSVNYNNILLNLKPTAGILNWDNEFSKFKNLLFD
ncbi:MAG: glycosyltransferase [Melioribacteraceae bacterium]|nr:glycosyltransferase [Melioribacteraceae bacterium]